MDHPKATNRLAADVESALKPDGTPGPEIKSRAVTPRGTERHDGWSLELTASEQAFLSRSLAMLTTREREVLFAICEGGTNDVIADRLCIALPTLRTHLMRLNQKLGTTSKGDVVRFVAAKVLAGYREGRIAPSVSG